MNPAIAVVANDETHNTVAASGIFLLLSLSEGFDTNQFPSSPCLSCDLSNSSHNSD